MRNAVIVGTGHSLPSRVVTSAEIEDRVTAASDGFVMPPGMIELVAGVAERRHVDNGTVSSDLAAQAGVAALRNAGADPDSLDVVIFASASHDVSEPATSAMVQDKLEARNATFADVKNACNSFLNGLDFAAAVIATGRAERVLVTSGEVLSPTINYEITNLGELSNRFAAFTLGDAGAAMLLEASDDPERGLRPGTFVSDGSKWRLSTVLNGGSLMGRDSSEWYFRCESGELQRLAVEYLPPLLRDTMTKLNWEFEDIGHVVPHQVSRMIVEEICRHLDYPVDQCRVTLDRFGNTAAASIPLAVSLADADGHLSPDDKVLLVCGAAGFTAGVLPIVW